ncbi:MAG: 50S ribosomal protein L13 [Exilispira sp.]|nr:50S ribosomal protein L13 [Exilispira sp.]
MIVYKTALRKPADLRKNWIIIDAKGLTLGRLAANISNILQGKNKVDYTPYWDNGDNVIVINAKYIHVTGEKNQKKIYYWHTRRPGGIKQATYEEMMVKHPEKPLQTAVKGMLPHNKLGRQLLKNLYIYPDADHPHSAQNPKPITFSGRM